MGHGIVDVFAFQEALLIEALFTIVILSMLWVGFRRWIQYKERTARLTSEQAAERAAQSDAQMRRIEARLKAVEQILTDSNAKTTAQIDARNDKSLIGPDLGGDPV